MSIKSSDAAKALKLIRMPAPKARAVLEKVAPKKTGKTSKGAKFVGTDVRGKFDQVATKKMGAGVVGRSLVARPTVQKESKPVSKARSVYNVWDAASPEDKPAILAAALRAGFPKALLKSFSDSEANNTVKS